MSDNAHYNFDEDDILFIRLSDKPITREIPQDWNTHISYAEDGSAVEVVLLKARANGVCPPEVQYVWADKNHSAEPRLPYSGYLARAGMTQLRQ